MYLLKFINDVTNNISVGYEIKEMIVSNYLLFNFLREILCILVCYYYFNSWNMSWHKLVKHEKIMKDIKM